MQNLGGLKTASLRREEDGNIMSSAASCWREILDQGKRKRRMNNSSVVVYSLIAVVVTFGKVGRGCEGYGLVYSYFYDTSRCSTLNTKLSMMSLQ